ncbi:hypothetical protein ABW20_dc0106683 [Dactylellina cionopaga]|nr:hypothetical protein ABW20_dc0106683 [Dactylellina cionopaga]
MSEEAVDRRCGRPYEVAHSCDRNLLFDPEFMLSPAGDNVTSLEVNKHFFASFFGDGTSPPNAQPRAASRYTASIYSRRLSDSEGDGNLPPNAQPGAASRYTASIYSRRPSSFQGTGIRFESPIEADYPSDIFDSYDRPEGQGHQVKVHIWDKVAGIIQLYCTVGRENLWAAIRELVGANHIGVKATVHSQKSTLEDPRR